MSNWTDSAKESLEEKRLAQSIVYLIAAVEHLERRVASNEAHTREVDAATIGMRLIG